MSLIISCWQTLSRTDTIIPDMARFETKEGGVRFEVFILCKPCEETFAFLEVIG